MSGVEEFEILLKDVVQAKRLSASKMTKLTEIATKCMNHDTQLVSVIYRTHKSLPSSSKVSSLYVFDAVARAAKHQVNKQKEHAASFLSKLGGVAEGLYRDMQDPDISEGKEKSKKVLDIWISKGTFPPDLLSRLGDILKGTDKAPEMRPSLNVDHVKQPEMTVMPPPMSPTRRSPEPSATTPAPTIMNAPTHAPALDPQATLLALLAQASNAGPVVEAYRQPTVNTTEAQLAAAQYVLQQLAQSTSAPHAQNVAPPIVSAPNDFSGHPNGSSRSPLADDARDPRRPLQSHREASRQEDYVNTLESGRPSYDSQSDNRPHARAPSTRGNPRGRGFGGGGDRGRRRWDDGHGDRDYPGDRDRGASYQSQQRDRSPPLAHRRGGGRGGRSRSRSPPPPSRYRERRRTPSPRRPPSWQQKSTRRSEPTLEAPSAKDEFGRDVRPASPPTAENGNGHPINGTLKSHSNTSASTPTSTATLSTFRAFSPPARSPRTPSHLPSVDITIPDPSNTSNHPISNTHAAPGTHTASSPPNILGAGSGMSATRSNGAASSQSGQSVATPLLVGANGDGGAAGLDEFDFASFDFGSPASWEALGKMWQTTYGRTPAGEQLMTFVVSMGAIKPEVGKSQAQAQQPQQATAIQQLQSWSGSDQEDQPYADYGGYGGRGRGRGGTARGGFRGGYGGGRGRGNYQGHTYGNSHGHGEMGHQSNWGYDDQGTDAIVLGGGDDPSPVQYSQTLQYGVGGNDSSDSSGGEGGKMQRVGDQWLFAKPGST